jgi:hypothetical protein
MDFSHKHVISTGHKQRLVSHKPHMHMISEQSSIARRGKLADVENWKKIPESGCGLASGSNIVVTEAQ